MWDWCEIFEWKNLVFIFLAILITIFKSHALLIGGIYFLFLGGTLFSKKSLSKALPFITTTLFGIFSLLLFFKIKFELNIVLYLFLILSLIFFSVIFFKNNDKSKSPHTIFHVLKIILYGYVSYLVLFEISTIISDIVKNGISTHNDYIFSIFVSFIIILLLSYVTKSIRILVSGKINNYLDISIGSIIFILFSGYILLTFSPDNSQMDFFLKIIASIFLLIGTISSLKYIIEENK